MIYNKSNKNLDWDTKKLNELGDFSRGKSKHRPRNDVKLFSKKGYPLIQTGEVKNANLYINENKDYYNDFGLKQSKLWNKGTLAITIAANIADSAILGYDMCFPDSIVGFEPYEKETSSEYMHYVLSYIQQSIQKSVNGSIQDNINIEYLQSLDFKMPKKQIQDEILDIIISLDKKNETNNKINVELEKMAKTLYDYWFVQFDFPNDEGKPYRTSGGAMTYNHTLKREIPKNWEVKNILSEIDWETGAQPPKSEHITKYKNGYIRFIQNRDYQDSSKHTTYIKISSTNSTCSRYDIMMDKYGNAGEVRYGIDGAFNVALAKITNTRENMQEYLRKYFESNVVFEYLHNACMASTRASLNGSTLSPLNIVIPKENLLKNFEKYNKQIINYILKNKQQNKQLAELRDFLLPLLMTGQVQVVERQEQSFSIDDGKEDIKNGNQYIDQRFDMWLATQGLAARGEVDKTTLRAIFDAMDDEDK